MRSVPLCLPALPHLHIYLTPITPYHDFTPITFINHHHPPDSLPPPHPRSSTLSPNPQPHRTFSTPPHPHIHLTRITPPHPHAGYFSLNGSVAQSECDIGTYNPSYGQSECIVCEPGFYCPNKRMTDHLMCSQGKYCGNATYVQLDCPPGTYSNELVYQPAYFAQGCYAVWHDE